VNNSTPPESASSDRRITQREAVCWRARVRRPLSVTEVEFEIRDFSNAGLYLGAISDAAQSFALSAAPGLLIEVLIPDQADEIAVQARGSVVRAGRGGLGIRLRDAGRECVSFLRLVNAPTLREPETDRLRLTPAQGQASALQALHEYFSDALQRYFATLDQDLFNAAKKARNPTEEGDLLRTRKQLMAARESVIEKFFGALMSAEPAAVVAPVRTQTSSSPLKLIERDELESWLASAELASFVEAKHGEPLSDLRALLKPAGASGIDVQIAAQPERFVRALNAAFAGLNLESSMRPQLYRTFQDQALNGLGDLFDKLSALLEQTGIRRDDDANPPGPKPMHPEVQPSTQPSARRALDYGVDEPTKRAAGAVQSALRLLARPAQARRYPISPAQPLPDDELIHELTQLIAQDAHSGSALQIDTLMERFEPSSQADRKSLSANQFEALDLLKRLSRSVRSEVLMPDAFFRWYRQLEPRMLADRLKLSDPTPAALRWRQVLGLLEFAAQQLRGRSDPPALEQVAKIKVLVEELSQGTPGDERPFELAEDLLTRMFGRQMKAARASETRVADACSGQQRLAEARRQVERELAASFGGRQVAVSLQALIDESIRDLLVLKAVQVSVSDPLWQEAFATLKSLNLALSAQRSDPQSHRTGLAALERLTFQLAQLAGNAKAQSALIGRIETELAGGCGEFRLYAPLHVTDVHDAAHEGQGNQRLQLLDVGDWLGLMDAEDEVRPAKLVWRASDMSRFVFVGQAGKKSHDLSATDLLERLDTGKAQVLEDWHLSIADRAWRRVVEDLHNELAHLATHDELTGLLNRREFERLLAMNLSAAVDANASGGLILIGLDGFARINATMDWETGDYALKAVAEALVMAAPAQSLLGRLESDRFILWLRGYDLRRTTDCAKELLDAVRELNPRLRGSQQRLTASAGVVAPLFGGAPQALKEVTLALVRAKEVGRDRVAQLDPTQTSQDVLMSAYHWLERLEQALANDQITLFAQPIRDLTRLDLSIPTHFEVLARIRNGAQVISPDSFLPVAERFNRMGAIDRHVVRLLLNALKTNRAAYETLEIVALNISAKSLTDANFIDFLINETRAAGLDPSKLCIEVTETVAIHDLSLAKVFMVRLKEFGFKLALDDFGSGWASYQYLKHLPVDFIKIDGAFIRDLGQSAQDFEMVRSINDLAHVLGKKTVGEHVFDETVLQRVCELKLDFGQGYALGRPEPLDELLARLMI